jgi:phage baseplate assembly protein V
MGLTLSELWRRIQNVMATATIVATQAKDGKMLVKVAYDDETKSEWLPVMSKNNSLLKIWMPPLVGEQVTVLRVFGNADAGIVFPSIFNKNCKEPNGANETNVIVEFSDGARFEYDTRTKELKVKAEEINLICNNLTVTGDANFQANVDILEALDVGGDISNDGSIETAGTVTDVMGDLTNFKTSNKGIRA